jgi:hypothetical protein
MLVSSCAHRASGAQRLTVHEVLEPAPGGHVVGVTSIAYLAGPPTERFTKEGRQSIRRAMRAGAVCDETENPAAFADLYEQASKAWGVSYRLDLIAAAAERGAARFFDVRIEGRAVGSAMALRGVAHWRYWLAAQNQEGRRAEVGYLAVAAMLDAVRAASATAVNLCASTGLQGAHSSRGRRRRRASRPRVERRLVGADDPR